MVFSMLCTVLLFTSVSALTAEKIILPDGRQFQVPKHESYSYILEEESSTSVERLYVISEKYSDVALLCPKGYSILEVTQELVKNLDFNNTIPEDTEIHHTGSLLHPEKFGKHGRPACPTLYDCLGYQACLFSFSSKFCYQNGLSHHTLLLTIICYRDDLGLTPQKFQKQKDQVLHMHTKHPPYHSIIPFNDNPEVLHTVLPEQHVFSGKCSTPTIAKEAEGFYGICSQLPPPNNVVSQELWIPLAKTFSKNCKNELQQVYCAFQYNQEGFCLPPTYHNKNKKYEKNFSFQSLPEIGPRPRSDGYAKFLLEHDPLLIPARLAFVILVNKETHTIMNLIHTIYRKEFIYVIHIDSRSITVREEFTRMIDRSNLPLHNIFIIPLERSFTTFPISYGTVRAQLEGFEELLRLGVWDFVINLFENDTVLRNVDDLAIALAPYRGLNFVSSLKRKPTEKESGTNADLIENAFFSCDGSVYNITSKSFTFAEEGLQIFYTSHGGTYSRQFIQYLVNEKLRSSVINRFQFYLQTDALPEESYIPSVLMDSPFKDSVHIAPIHVPFGFHREVHDSFLLDSDHPPEMTDSRPISKVFSMSHISFFVERNYLQIPDDALIYTQELVIKEYYKFIEKYLPPQIIQILVEKALAILLDGNLVLETVLHVHVTPSLIPHDTCCRSDLIQTYHEFANFNYWLDVSLFNKTSNSKTVIRLMLQPAVFHTHCYGNGDLKIVTILPWKSYEDRLDQTERLWLSSKHSLPFPYGPAYIESVSINLLLAKNTENMNCINKDDSNSEPLTFNDENVIMVELRLIAPNQDVRCIANSTLVWDTNNNSTSSSDYKTKTKKPRLSSQTLEIPCKTMEPGFWTLQLRKIGSSRSRVYSISFYLLDLQNSDTFEKQLKNVSLLWTLKSFAVVTQNYTFNFHEHEKYEEEKLSLPIQNPSSQIDESFFKNHWKFFPTRRGRVTEQFICSGGFASSILLLVAVIWIYSWRYQYIRNIVFISILALFLGVMLQIILFLSLCDQ